MKKVVSFDYTIRKSKRSKHIRLTVRADGKCTVSAPLRVNDEAINKFVFSKQEWVKKALDKFKDFKPISKGKNKIKNKAESRADFLKHKEEARALVISRLNYFNKWYGFSWKRIAIRNQKTRWGSCSHMFNLNFSYRLILLPSRLSDYVILHELCHIGELNHGPNFWKLIEKNMPDYEIRKKELVKFSRGMSDNFSDHSVLS